MERNQVFQEKLSYRPPQPPAPYKHNPTNKHAMCLRARSALVSHVAKWRCGKTARVDVQEHEKNRVLGKL